MTCLITCKPEYQKMLEGELAMHNFAIQKSGHSWFLVETGLETVCKKIQLNDFCFAQAILVNPTRVNAQSVNSFAARLDELFRFSIENLFISKPFPVLFFAPETEPLGYRLKTIEKILA